MQIDDGVFSYTRHPASIQREAELDSIYVSRTSEPRERLSAEATVRGYKNLAVVERLLRTLKGIDILVRPIHHHPEKRVHAHLLLCVLAYYVEWHMRQALAPVVFDDERARHAGLGGADQPRHWRAADEQNADDPQN